jgi:DNA-binding beta-propeller fold protein YncE
VANAGDGTVWRITGGRVVRKIRVGVEPNGLIGADWIVGRGGYLYVSQETNRVAKVDIRSLKVVGRVATGRNPLGSAFVGARLWVPCIDSAEIDVVDPAAMRVVQRKRTAPSPIVVLPAFGHVWVSHTTGDALTRY